MNKRLLIYALLSMGQLVYTSSYVFASALTDSLTAGDGTVSPGHMHHKASSSAAVVTMHDGVLPKPPSYIRVEALADLTDGLSKGALSTISIQMMRDFELSDILDGTSYSFIQGLNIGSFAKLKAGDLRLIVSAFSNLTELTLGNNAVSIPSDELASELRKLSSLRKLNIAGESVTDEVIEALVPLAGTLQILHLNNANITARGADLLKSFENLTELNVLGTRAVGKDEAAAIIDKIPALDAKGALKRNRF